MNYVLNEWLSFRVNWTLCLVAVRTELYSCLMENEALLKQSSSVDSQLSSLFRILKALRSIFDCLNLSNH